MAFITIAKPDVGDPTTKDLADDLIDNLITLNTQSTKIGLVPNDSFELDEDADGDPDGWEFTDYTGGTHAIDTTNHAHGAQGIKFTSTVLANGGGFGDLEDYITIAEAEIYSWKVWRKASVANISCQFQATWYTAAKSSISTSTLFQDTNTPTTYTLASGVVTAPSTARFVKLRVEGGVPAVGSATGDITFDGVGLDTNFPASIGRGELRTTTASASVGVLSGSSASRSLTGWGYTWWTASAQAATALNVGVHFGAGNTAAGTIGLYNSFGSTRTFYVDENYIQASPPYTHGPLFIFLIIDNGTGDIEAIDVAPDPPWAYHGPTNITPDKISGDKSYKSIQMINDIPINIALKDISIRNIFMAGNALIKTAEIEIDLNYKDSDRDINPHPWAYNASSFFINKTVIMLEPGTVLMERLFTMLEVGGAGIVRQLIEDGYLNIQNIDINIPNKPVGIQVVRANWKNTL